VACVAAFAGAVAFVAACSGEDPAWSVGDGRDAGAADVETEADERSHDPGDGRCDPSAPFAIPVPVDGLATREHAEYTARLSPDERVVYFSRYRFDRDGGFALLADLFTASRASTSAGFGPATIVSDLSSDAEEDSPTVTADGREILFARGEDLASYRIWRRGMPSPEVLSGPVNEGESAQAPYLLPDGHALYFTGMRGTEQTRIYRAERGEGGYVDVQPVAGLGTQAAWSDYGAVVTPDELTIYWSSRRGTATTEIYVATRADTSSPFSGVHVVAEVSTSARDEAPSFISADGCRLYYSSSVAPTQQRLMLESDILVATRPR
jgi:hypothetical protein